MRTPAVVRPADALADVAAVETVEDKEEDALLLEVVERDEEADGETIEEEVVTVVDGVRAVFVMAGLGEGAAAGAAMASSSDCCTMGSMAGA